MIMGTKPVVNKTISILIPSTPALKLIPICGIQEKFTKYCVLASGVNPANIKDAMPNVTMEEIKAICFAYPFKAKTNMELSIGEKIKINKFICFIASLKI